MTNLTLKRANETIGIIPKDGQRLTSAIRKLYAAILLFSQHQGIKDVYTARLSDILDVASLTTTKNNPEIKKHFMALRSFTVEWNTRTEEDAAIWSASGLLEVPKIISTKHSPTIVTWCLCDEIKAKLIDPQGFYTKFSLEMMTKLRMGGSIALYEICSRYANNSDTNGIGYTSKESIDIWMPKIVGVKKTGYEYRFFKRSILNPAIEEVNKTTDINVVLNEFKTGKKITDLQFMIKKKDETEFSRLSKEVQKRLGGAGISKRNAATLANSYTNEQISTQLDILEGVTKNGKNIENPSAFLRAGLANGWTPNALKKKVQKPMDATPKPPAAPTIDDQSIDTGAMQKDILKLLDDMNPATREAVLKDFYDQESNFVQSLYRNQYLESIVVVTAFHKWYRSTHQL